MKSIKTKYVLLSLAGLVLVAALAFYLSRTGSSGSKPVTIAANLPLSGVLATYGVSVREGAMMRLAEQAESAPTKNQALVFSVDWQDNAGDPTTAVTILRRQLLSDPAIYISGVKPQTMAIKADVSSAGIPHFVWIFDAVINDGTANNFRTWVSYKIEPTAYLNYVQAHAAKRVAITYVQLPHTVDEFERIVLPELRRQGRTLTVLPYEFGKTDFRDIALKMAAFKPDLIILNGFQSDLVGLVRALRPLRLLNDGNTIATYDMLDAAKVLGADEIEGIRVVAPEFEFNRGASADAWRKRFFAKYGREPLYTHAFAYDMMSAIIEAGRNLPQPASHADWIKALRALDISGVTGPIRFDSDGDMVTPLRVGTYRKGSLVPAP
jgi:branched-chain amino acid transport system substrate-binding protein